MLENVSDEEAELLGEVLTLKLQYWPTSGPKFGPTPASQSIHWAGIGLGMLSPAPNRTQLGQAEMEAKPDPGEASEGRSGNCGWLGDPT